MGKKSFKTRRRPIVGDALDALEIEKGTGVQTIEDQGSADETKKLAEPNDNKTQAAKSNQIHPEATERRSFIVNSKKFDRFLDFIYIRKVTGDFRYTQEKALDQAFDLLFGTVKKIAPGRKKRGHWSDNAAMPSRRGNRDFLSKYYDFSRN